MKGLSGLPGITVQAPISRHILDGTKLVETRTYPISKKYLGKPIALIETPGPSREFKSRIIAIITFTKCFSYKSKREFYADQVRHKVDPTSPWAWVSEKPKWGWEIGKIEPIFPPLELRRRPGIIYTAKVEI